MPPAVRAANPLCSVVVPVLDEEGCVAELADRVRAALQSAGVRHEILFVDDGSRDRTPERILELRAQDPGVKTVRFTRRFGQQAALAAGLRFARGDAVVTMDSDLQHPPEFLPELLRAWREGFDVVHTVRRPPLESRPGFKERASRLFYRLMGLVSSIPVIPAAADFRLLDRRAVDAFNALEERFVFVRGLVPWLGFPETRLEYDVAPRFADRSKYSLLRMLRLALDGVFSFSVLPLRLITALGLVTTLFGILYGAFALVAWLLGRVSEPGWTSLMVLVLVFGGVQLLSIGVVSEYVGRTYEEVKHRPRYVIDRVEGLEWP